jgi:parvulin-like peptidyl-prolyl isomerase
MCLVGVAFLPRATFAQAPMPAPTTYVPGGVPGQLDTLDEPIADALCSLPGEGTVSEPFAVDGGWAIVALVRRVPGREANYDAVSAMVKSEIRDQRIRTFVEGLNDEK